MNTKITEIINTLQGHFLYTYLSGSRVLDYINSPSDYDIIFVCKNLEDRKECIDLFRANYNIRELYKQYNLDIHIVTTTYDSLYSYCRLYPHNFLTGNEVYELLKQYMPEQIDLQQFLELEPSIKAHYKANITKLLSPPEVVHINREQDYIYKCKLWYIIYTNMCIFKNKSAELTDIQIENINILHDRKKEDFNKRKELIDSIIEEMNTWQI